jgi:sugar lactone lactonase YvrE
MKNIRFIIPLLLAGFALALLPACTSTGSKCATSGARPFTPLKLGQVRGVALDSVGNLYVPDLSSATLYKITPAGAVSVLPSAPIQHLHSVTVAPDGTLYAVETEVSRVHRLGENGATSLVPLERKDVFLGATTLVCDAAGNLYIGENDVNIVRKVTPAGEFSIYAGAFKQRGNQDGSATEARFTRPRALAIDRAGNLYVGDEAAHVIRKITPAGTVTTLAGKAGERGSQDGVGAAARFASPRGLAADKAGNVYVMDTGNHAIRKVAPDGSVTTFAGKAGEAGFVDGPVVAARFAGLRAAAFDAAGNLYVADSDNGAVRLITPDGRVRTIVAAQLPPRHEAN